MDLDIIKKTIESFTKENQIEILRIIHQSSPGVINENKSGIYINMSFLTNDVIEKMTKYIDYVQDQEKMLKPFETEKDNFKNTFFIEKEVKDTILYTFRHS
jgi:hypothetical protein